MRERAWRALRKSKLLRDLYSLPMISAVMKRASYVLVSPEHRSLVRVESGPGQGLILEINPRWEHALWDGVYESKVQGLVAELCRPGSVFFDIGANFGYYSMLATRCGASVVAFEPDPKMIESLLTHAKLNSLEGKFQLERKAVSCEGGEIFLDPSNEGTLHGNAHV